MKKALAVLLCVLLMWAAASAEETEKTKIGSININGAFTLQCGLPEGYRIQPIRITRDQLVAVLTSQDPEMPVMHMSVAFDETYSDVARLNELSQEELEVLEKTFTEVDPTVDISYGDTGLGTRLLIARQSNANLNYIDFMTIYEGYFCEFVMVPSETAKDKTLTDEQLKMCIDFLTDLDFVPEGDPSQAGSEIAGKKWIARLTDYDPVEGTVKAELKRAITLSPDAVKNLKTGDRLNVGETNIVVETVETLEDGSILVNDDISLVQYGDEVHVYEYDIEYIETFANLTLKVPDTLVFTDEIDPATGEMLDEAVTRDAAAFIAVLTGEAEDIVGFESDNVYVSLGENEEMLAVERFYSPAQ